MPNAYLHNVSFYDGKVNIKLSTWLPTKFIKTPSKIKYQFTDYGKM